MRFYFFTIIFLLHIDTNAQAITTSDLLKNYNSSISFLAYDDYILNINKFQYKIPIIEEIGFRTQTNNFDINRQDYALRLKFNSFNASKVYKNEQANLITGKQIEKSIKEKDLLFDLYNDIISLRYAESESPVFDSLQLVYEQKLDLLIKIIGSGDFVQAKDILKLEESIYELNQKKKIAALKINEAKAKLNLSEKTQFVNFNDWVTISTIESNLQNLQYKLPFSESEKLRLDALNSETSYLLDKAQDKRILDFAQFRYRSRSDKLFEENATISFGLRLPYKGSHIKSLNDYYVKQQDLIFKSNIIATKGNEKFNRNMIEIKALIDEWKFYKNSSEKIFKTLNESHIANTLEIVNAKKMLRLANKEKQLGIEKKIVVLYIILIQDADKIMDYPLKNYLTEQQVLIK